MSMSSDLGSMTHAEFVNAYGGPQSLEDFLEMKATSGISGGGGGGTGSFGITVDGGGSVLTSGSKGFVVVPFACTITGWSIVADQSGSVAFGVEKAADGVIPSTSIVASAAPALSAAQVTRSTTLTGWTTAVTANDVIEFTVTGSPVSITRATLQIHYTK